MKGWRARIGFLIPPGNPTIESEVPETMPDGVSCHFSRMVAPGEGGSLSGQEDRNRSQIEHIDGSADLLAKVKPDVMVLAHTATSYTLGSSDEAALVARLQAKYSVPFTTAFASVVAALDNLGVRKIALGAPYNETVTLQGKRLLEAHGFAVVSCGRLENVSNIFDETPERAYRLGRSVDTEEAEAVFLSGLGMPSIAILDMLETDVGKPVISAASAMVWNALRTAGVQERLHGYGRLLREW